MFAHMNNSQMVSQNARQQGASSDSNTTPLADFELDRRESGGWCLRILTARALHWYRANYSDWDDVETVLDLTEANAFLRHARKNNLRTLYKGPVAPTVI